MAKLTACRRFGGRGPRNYRDLQQSILAYPGIKFFTFSCSTVAGDEDVSSSEENQPSQKTLAELTEECFDYAQHFLSDPREQVTNNVPVWMYGPTALFYTGFEPNQAMEARLAGLSYLHSSRRYVDSMN